MTTPTAAPRGDIASFTREQFAHGGFSHAVYRKGSGPAVLIMTELPGITQFVLGFADRVAAIGCSAILPDLFGRAGYEPRDRAGWLAYGLRSLGQVCISREFTTFAAGQASPVVDYLRALAAREHARCGGPGVGVIGMCFTGGFALSMAVDARVLAPVLAQPSLPFALGRARRAGIDCTPETLDRIASRCANEGLRVLGLRFRGDPIVPRERFELLRHKLGDGFVAIQLTQADRHPGGITVQAHSVLTGDLIDEPTEPTREALEHVLALFRSKLLGSVT